LPDSSGCAFEQTIRYDFDLIVSRLAKAVVVREISLALGRTLDRNNTIHAS
jgi:hypothetical protein